MNRRNILALLAGTMVFTCGLILASPKERPSRGRPSSNRAPLGHCRHNLPRKSNHIDYEILMRRFDENKDGKIRGEEKEAAYLWFWKCSDSVWGAGSKPSSRDLRLGGSVNDVTRTIRSRRVRPNVPDLRRTIIWRNESGFQVLDTKAKNIN